MIGILVKMVICGILVHVIVSETRHVKLEYLYIENCSCEKHLFDKLVLVCEGEMSNITEATVKDLSCTTSFVDKKVTYEKIDCLNQIFH